MSEPEEPFVTELRDLAKQAALMYHDHLANVLTLAADRIANMTDEADTERALVGRIRRALGWETCDDSVETLLADLRAFQQKHSTRPRATCIACGESLDLEGSTSTYCAVCAEED